MKGIAITLADRGDTSHVAHVLALTSGDRRGIALRADRRRGARARGDRGDQWRCEHGGGAGNLAGDSQDASPAPVRKDRRAPPVRPDQAARQTCGFAAGLNGFVLPQPPTRPFVQDQPGNAWSQWWTIRKVDAAVWPLAWRSARPLHRQRRTNMGILEMPLRLQFAVAVAAVAFAASMSWTTEVEARPCSCHRKCSGICHSGIRSRCSACLQNCRSLTTGPKKGGTSDRYKR